MGYVMHARGPQSLEHDLRPVGRLCMLSLCTGSCTCGVGPDGLGFRSAHFGPWVVCGGAGAVFRGRRGEGSGPASAVHGLWRCDVAQDLRSRDCGLRFVIHLPGVGNVNWPARLRRPTFGLCSAAPGSWAGMPGLWRVLPISAMESRMCGMESR